MAGKPLDAPKTIPEVVKKAPETVRRVFSHLYAISDDSGFFDLDAEAIATTLGLSRPTIYRAITRLKRVNLLLLVEYRTGRGQHSLYQVNWRKPKQSLPSQSVSPLVYSIKKKNTLKTDPCLVSVSLKGEKAPQALRSTHSGAQPQDWSSPKEKTHQGDGTRMGRARHHGGGLLNVGLGQTCSALPNRAAPGWQASGLSQVAPQACASSRSRGAHATQPRQPDEYLASDAAWITLVMGARFYRKTMQKTRLSFADWPIPESHKDALEGFLGNRIDGASLAYAWTLLDFIHGQKDRIVGMVRAGASARRVCSYIAGLLAGVPEKRAAREVKRRTVELMTDMDEIVRRMSGIRSWEHEREREFSNGQKCSRCGHRHTESEYKSGYNDEDDSLNCFGWARTMIGRLEDRLAHLKEQQQWPQCARCGQRIPPDSIIGSECFACRERTYKIHANNPLEEVGIMLGIIKPQEESMEQQPQAVPGHPKQQQPLPPRSHDEERQRWLEAEKRRQLAAIQHLVEEERQRHRDNPLAYRHPLEEPEDLQYPRCASCRRYVHPDHLYGRKCRSCFMREDLGE